MNSLISLANSFGGRFFNFAMPMLLQSSLVIVLLLGIDAAIRSRARGVFRYVLGMLMLAKLLLPPSFASPTAVAYWWPEPTTMEQPLLKPAPKPQISYAEKAASTAVRVATALNSSDGPATITLQGAVFAVWLAGVMGLMVLLVHRSKSILQMISEAAPAPAWLQALACDCAAQLNLSRPVQVNICPSSHSPALCGTLKPVILIPKHLMDNLSTEQMRAVLLHELAHYKRGDVWVNHTQTLLQIAYWYHPLLWAANAHIRRLRELAVDEQVMVTMKNESGAYPATLVEIAKLTFARPLLALGLVGIMESKNALKQRIRRLVEHPAPKTVRIGLPGLSVVFLCAAMIIPMGLRPAKANAQATPSNEAGRAEPYTAFAESGTNIDAARWKAKDFPVLTRLSLTRHPSLNGRFDVSAAVAILKEAGYTPGQIIGFDRPLVDQIGEKGLTIFEAAALVLAGRETAVQGVVEPMFLTPRNQTMRTFHVNPSLFPNNLEYWRDELMLPPSEPTLNIFHALLNSVGVYSEPPHALSFNKDSGEIIMSNTPEAIDLAERIILEANQPNDQHAIFQFPRSKISVLTKAQFMKMTDATFKDLKLGKSKQVQGQAGDFYSLNPQEFQKTAQRIEKIGATENLRIQTAPGVTSGVNLGNEQHNINLSTRHYVRGRNIDMVVLARTVGEFNTNAACDWPSAHGWTNVGWYGHVSVPDGGGVVLRARQDGAAPTNNLVVVLTSSVIREK